MLRGVAYGVLPAEILLVVSLVLGVSIPWVALVAAEVAVFALVVAEAFLAARIYRRHRAGGLAPRAAARAAVGELVPEPVLLMMAHELKSTASIGYLLAGRRHGVRDGAVPIGYARQQTPMLAALLVACVLETWVLHLVLPWPAVRLVLLVLDAYTVLFVLALIAAGFTRPHVAGPGELRLRWGALIDLRVPMATVTAVRAHWRHDHQGMLELDGTTMSLTVSSQTNVVVELSEPVTVTRPLGRKGTARVLRFYADDPGAAVTAINRARNPAPAPAAAEEPAS
ncbi:hypothetical protein [Sphaerisporangium sp. TRM90804]|uniref:hypothetical protein n=1 Tax=Sphaerisporangium sp. TRM90804 TaxID=3031113 RepID=UPI002448354A|nr:hypothetical protein [Sphaerisporangium sp. TRM90804]MDH2426278.1 hypothetical protein [Sphaerisporangium sp. TRM90804]